MTDHSANSIQPIEGIIRSMSKAAQTAQAISSGKFDPDHMVQLIRSQRDVEANVAVMKTQQSVSNSLLNILA